MAGGGGFHDGGELGDADAGDDAGGADGAGADADLDAVRAGVDEGARAFGGGDVAGDDLQGVRQALDAGDGAQHAFRMAVRGVDDDDVDLGGDEGFRAGVAVIAHAGGGGDAEAAELVLVGEGVGLGLVHVLDGDEAHAAVGVIDDQELLDAMAVEEAAGVLPVDLGGDGDEVLAGHQLVDAGVGVGGEADVAVGEDADEAAGVALDDREAADVVQRHEGAGLGEGLVGVDGEGVHDHPALELLDPADLGGLFGDVEVLVDDADAAELGHGDGHCALGDGVHGGRDEGDVQLDGAGEAGAGADGAGQDLAVGGDDEDVVEGEGFLDAGDACLGLGAGSVGIGRHGGTFHASGDAGTSRGRGPLPWRFHISVGAAWCKRIRGAWAWGCHA